jgi:hypothetical protein
MNLKTVGNGQQHQPRMSEPAGKLLDNLMGMM